MRYTFADRLFPLGVIPEIIDMISEMMKTHFANPSSTHSFGRESKIVVENSLGACNGQPIETEDCNEQPCPGKIFLVDL